MIKKFKPIFAIGLMSGTSIDGIDVTLVKTNGISLERYNYTLKKSYTKKTYDLLQNVIAKAPESLKNKKAIQELDYLITIEHFKIIKKIINVYKIVPDIVGFHGQTIYHNSKNKITVQLGNSRMLSDLLKIQVVGDFRKNDMKQGGEGAPLAPIYHQFLIKSLKLNLPSCFINIGGVSNLTYWDGYNLIGYDTGPGNGLMDLYMQKKYSKKFDFNGQLASKGLVVTKILHVFLNDPYFKVQYPKSLDKMYFYYILDKMLKEKITPENIMATLSEMIAQSINLSIMALPKFPENICLMGGGMYNKHLLNNIKKITQGNVFIAEEINLPGEIIEAELIAFLAVRKLYNLPVTFPKTTGTNKPTTAGVIFK